MCFCVSFQADTFDHMFRPSEGIPAWPLLLPSENISKAVIVDKVDLSALTTALVQAPLVRPTSDLACHPGLESGLDQVQPVGSEALSDGAPSLALDLNALSGSGAGVDQCPADRSSSCTDSSAQSSVTYSTVLLCDPKQEQRPIHLYKDGSGSSSSDEGNFSANNSDISGSFPGGLWELDDPRRSCSYNSVGELSETSEQENEEEAREEKELYYLGMDYPAEEIEEDEEQTEVGAKTELLKNIVLNGEDCSLEWHPLLHPEDSSELLSASPCSFSPLYLPQFRTARCTRQLTAPPHDSRPQL